MAKKDPDIIIIGGGVAGLSASIGSIRGGLKNVILLEKNNEFGLRIKGEVINKDAEIFKKIFKTKGGLPENVINIVFKTAKYYTPSMKKSALRKFPNNIKVGIEYRKLIDELLSVAIKEEVDIRINSRVLELIKQNNKIIGVKFQEFGVIKELYPKIIICAVGLHSNLSIPSIKAPKNVCLANKFNVRNINLSDQFQLDFFLLDIPGVIYIFPKSKTEAELGIMIWTDQIHAIDNINPNNILHNNIEKNPILKDRLINAKIIYYSKEKLAMGGSNKEIFTPNTFFIGDLMGHVGAVGGSGIISCLNIGYDLGLTVSKLLLEKDELTNQDFLDCQRMINKSEIGKWLKKEQSNAKLMREILYKDFKNIDHIDSLWDKFKYLVESRGA